MIIRVKSFFSILTLFFIILALSSCTKEDEELQDPKVEYQYSDTIEVVIDPNPNSGTFTIIFDQAYQKIEIEISNIQGKVIFSFIVTNSNQKMLSLDIAKGVYFLKLISQSGYTTSKRFVVE